MEVLLYLNNVSSVLKLSCKPCSELAMELVMYLTMNAILRLFQIVVNCAKTASNNLNKETRQSSYFANYFAIAVCTL